MGRRLGGPKAKKFRQRNGRQNASPTTASNYITVGEGSPLPKKEKITAKSEAPSERGLPTESGGGARVGLKKAIFSSCTHSPTVALRHHLPPQGGLWREQKPHGYAHNSLCGKFEARPLGDSPQKWGNVCHADKGDGASADPDGVG